jgi:hypothetical protein
MHRCYRSLIAITFTAVLTVGPATAARQVSGEAQIAQYLALLAPTAPRDQVVGPDAHAIEEAYSGLLSMALASEEERDLVVTSIVAYLQDVAGDRAQGYSSAWLVCCGILGELRAVEAIPILSANLDVQCGAFRTVYPSLQALAKIGGPAIDALETVLQTGDRRQRNLAIRTLCAIDTSASRNALVRALTIEQDLEIREFAENYINKARAN